MNAGFAMVETGFTRAKNAGNILMKNLIDFCIAAPVFWLLGYGLMHGIDNGGFIGTPTNPFTEVDTMKLMFHMVFCATAATIVSGAMAERTKFSAYCIYSFAISVLIYPISGHWIWGGGWLSQIGFVDFAGSTAVHLVGGVCALVGAIILGPRLGKYKKNPSTGKLESTAIPGHSITLGALGCFILWFGWYGFNGASQYALGGLEDVVAVSNVLVTTTIAAALATITGLIITWVRYKKPDVSMTFNAALAGLVAVTAGCATVTIAGAAIIGIIAAFVVVFGIEFIDKKLHIDDPVGAIGVHCLNGALGTILVGVFSYDKGIISGFIYNPDLTASEAFKFLGIQILGVVVVFAWTAALSFGIFMLIKKINGLRASDEEQILGLDAAEHGLPSAYADFTSAAMSSDGISIITSASVPVEYHNEGGAHAYDIDDADVDKNKFTKVVILARPERFDALKIAFNSIGITGMTVTSVLGCGMQKGQKMYRGVHVDINLLPKVKVEIVVCKVPVKLVVDTAKSVLHSGDFGDGKIFIYDVENVIKVRTGEEGYDALQDVL